MANHKLQVPDETGVQNISGVLKNTDRHTRSRNFQLRCDLELPSSQGKPSLRARTPTHFSLCASCLLFLIPAALQYCENVSTLIDDHSELSGVIVPYNLGLCYYSSQGRLQKGGGG